MVIAIITYQFSNIDRKNVQNTKTRANERKKLQIENVEKKNNAEHSTRRKCKTIRTQKQNSDKGHIRILHHQRTMPHSCMLSRSVVADDEYGTYQLNLLQQIHGQFSANCFYLWPSVQRAKSAGNNLIRKVAMSQFASVISVCLIFELILHLNKE